MYRLREGELGQHGPRRRFTSCGRMSRTGALRRLGLERTCQSSTATSAAFVHSSREWDPVLPQDGYPPPSPSASRAWRNLIEVIPEDAWTSHFLLAWTATTSVGVDHAVGSLPELSPGPAPVRPHRLGSVGGATPGSQLALFASQLSRHQHLAGDGAMAALEIADHRRHSRGRESLLEPVQGLGVGSNQVDPLRAESPGPPPGGPGPMANNLARWTARIESGRTGAPTGRPCGRKVPLVDGSPARPRSLEHRICHSAALGKSSMQSPPGQRLKRPASASLSPRVRPVH